MKKLIPLLITVVLFFSSVKTNAQMYWHSVDGGLGDRTPNQGVSSLLNDTIHHVLLAAGNFTVANASMADSVQCSGVATWNETTWMANGYIPGGLLRITCFAFYQGKIFAGDAGGYVFYFNGNKWQIACGFDDAISCMAVYHNKLYVGGDFHYADTLTAYHIACFDGVKWSKVGRGIYWSGSIATVWAMHVWNDKLYVGGAFDFASNKIGDIPANSIAAWNDTAWSALGRGITTNTSGLPQGFVFSLADYNNELYAGGRFDSAGGVFVLHIARWDGNTWHEVKGGVGEGGRVRSMLATDSILYVGGGFGDPIGTTNSGGIAQWNGSNWEGVGDSDLHNGGIVLDMAIYNSTLYIGGDFTQIGNKPVYSIARLLNYPDTVNAVKKIENDKLIYCYPNPTTNKLHIKTGNAFIQQVNVSNIIGQQLITTTLPQAKNETDIDVSRLPQGMYLLRLKTNAGWQVGKFVKE